MYSAPWSPSPHVLNAFNGQVIALDPRTGGVVWQTPLGGNASELRLDVSESLVVVLGWHRLAVLDYATGAIRFQLDVAPNQPMNSTMLVDGGLVYLSFMGSMTCVSLSEQRVLWKNDLPGTGNGAAALGVPGRTIPADLGRR